MFTIFLVFYPSKLLDGYLDMPPFPFNLCSQPKNMLLLLKWIVDGFKCQSVVLVDPTKIYHFY